MAVEKISGGEADKKLAAGRVWIAGSGHGKHALVVRAIAEFSFDLVAGIAGAPTKFLARILGERVAALDHETLHNPVKAGAVIKRIVGEFLEILHCFRGCLGPKLYY